jgi:cell division septal protein FtsQ
VGGLPQKLERRKKERKKERKEKKRKDRKKERKTLKPCTARNTVVYGFFWPVIFMKLQSHSGLLLKMGTALKIMRRINNTVHE